jgi:hypothetical protein
VSNIAYVRGTFGQAPLPALPAAGANTGLFALITPDDNLTRTVTGIYVSDQTRLGHTQLFNGQRKAADIMHELFAVVDQFVTLDETFAPGIQINLIVFNDSVGALTANTGVIVRYTVGEPAAQGAIPGL